MTQEVRYGEISGTEPGEQDGSDRGVLRVMKRKIQFQYFRESSARNETEKVAKKLATHF